MRLGIMQPYFFPYMGHFSLIAHTDEWIVFDITQYTPKTWMNRNRILHPQSGWNWVSVPLSNSSISIKTMDARIQDIQSTGKSILGKLSHYRKTAPYYFEVESIVREVFSSSKDDDSLVHLNLKGLDLICEYIGLPFKRNICSEMGLVFPKEIDAGGWALEICSQLGADSYLNPVGGKALFDTTRFKERGIELNFLRSLEFSYETATFPFIPGLSIIDVLMWNDPAKVHHAIKTGVEILT